MTTPTAPLIQRASPRLPRLDTVPSRGGTQETGGGFWRMAAADTATVSSGMVSFGLVLGITVHVLGRDTFAALMGAGTVYGGSAQLTTTTLISHGTSLVIAVLSGMVVNLRLLLYSAAMGDRFAGQPRSFRWFGPHLMIDQTFLMSETRRDLEGRSFRRYWLRLGFLVLLVWMSSVALGLLVAPVLPSLPHLTLVCTAMFIGLLVPRLVSRPAIAAALAGSCTAALVSQLLPAFGIVTGALAGVVAGMAAHRPRS